MISSYEKCGIIELEIRNALTCLFAWVSDRSVSTTSWISCTLPEQTIFTKSSRPLEIFRSSCKPWRFLEFPCFLWKNRNMVTSPHASWILQVCIRQGTRARVRLSGQVSFTHLELFPIGQICSKTHKKYQQNHQNWKTWTFSCCVKFKLSFLQRLAASILSLSLVKRHVVAPQFSSHRFDPACHGGTQAKLWRWHCLARSTERPMGRLKSWHRWIWPPPRVAVTPKTLCHRCGPVEWRPAQDQTCSKPQVMNLFAKFLSTRELYRNPQNHLEDMLKLFQHVSSYFTSGGNTTEYLGPSILSNICLASSESRLACQGSKILQPLLGKLKKFIQASNHLDNLEGYVICPLFLTKLPPFSRDQQAVWSL